jgi:hypothetical protein
MIAAITRTHHLDDHTTNFLHPCAFTATTDKDALHYGEMLQAEDRSNFVQAMQTEMAGITDILEVVPRSSIPMDNKPLPAVWAFRRKRLPVWTISK